MKSREAKDAISAGQILPQPKGMAGFHVSIDNAILSTTSFFVQAALTTFSP